MAKINHNNHIDTINALFGDARRRGLMHLYTDESSAQGRSLEFNEKELVNFGTCGYLGIETDERLIEGAVEYVRKYGAQFSVSRAYLTLKPNAELENLLSQMYGAPAIVYSSTSLVHISLIPTLMKDTDAIILDQQVHMSVQTGAQLMRQKGLPIEMIRHSNMEMLERKIKELGDRYTRIWYMIDGVYSMFGDVAPFDELKILMDKYPQLYLYVDDCHGMSWYGDNGTGYAFSKMGLHPKMLLNTTLAKGFGVTGGVAIFPNEEWYDKVRLFGGPLSYSHPLAPPVLGSALASARIHLSDDIYEYQAKLNERINHCNVLLEKSGLPVVSDPLTPIYNIGMGQPRVGYNMVRRLFNEGYYVNTALFPAVPIKNTGVRYTLNTHLTLDDITGLVNAMAYHYPLALEEEEVTDNDIRKAFRLPLKEASPLKADLLSDKVYKVQQERTIKNINREEWNNLLGKNGTYDYDGLMFLEETFSGNEKPEENWDFYYFVIRDKQNKPLLATFFSHGIYKDDLLAPFSVSKQIEERRITEPYHLTSLTLAMGCMMSEGQHFYLDRKYENWREVMKLLFEEIDQLKEQTGSNVVLLRDFETADEEMRTFLMGEGFIKVDMPLSNVVKTREWSCWDGFLEGLSTRSRRHIREDVIRFEHYYDVEIKSELTPQEQEDYYDLYVAVENRNLGMNLFRYPRKIMDIMSKYPQWEFLILRLKPEYDDRPGRPALACLWCYKTDTGYAPMIIGMDYDYVFTHNVYKQAIYQVLARARDLGIPEVRLGYSADIEKKKYGAVAVAKSAFVQAKDNFNFEVIESMSVFDLNP
jgi:7-keto-8-aminopelargonate synthetase-like enzyme